MIFDFENEMRKFLTLRMRRIDLQIRAVACD